jgi:DNA polymerase-3 subunit delta
VTAVPAAEVDAALRRLDPRIVALLFYGPDAGLVGERARAAAERVVADPSDPFQLVRLEGDILASDPGRLADEAGTVGLFGERRAIWIRPTSRNIAPAIENALALDLKDTLLVIEAGNLARGAPLRTLCERWPGALALPCFADTGGSLLGVIDESLRVAGLSIDRDARAQLAASLGGDRLATRAELAKLALYVGPKGSVTLDDIDAVISDVSALALDAVVDAAFDGDMEQVEAGCRRLRAEGVSPSLILGGALRQALLLLGARLDVEAGQAVGNIVRAWRGLHFRRQKPVERQLSRWKATALRQAIAQLQAAILATRQVSDVADALAARALFAIARDAAGSAAR